MATVFSIRRFSATSFSDSRVVVNGIFRGISIMLSSIRSSDTTVTNEPFASSKREGEWTSKSPLSNKSSNCFVNRPDSNSHVIVRSTSP